MSKRVCLVVGAGDGLGAAVAERFASGGYVSCVARRNGDKLAPLLDTIHQRGGDAYGFGLDARDETAVDALFDDIERRHGPIDVCVFNVGGNQRIPLLDMKAETYRKFWEQCAFSGLLTIRAAIRHMAPRGRGTIIATGASASLRGGSGFAGFAGGKNALRSLAQSAAREYGPKGIHVAHVVVDGVIDSPAARARHAEKVAKHGDAAFIPPGDLAELYWFLHNQKPGCWTHECDVRPSIETW